MAGVFNVGSITAQFILDDSRTGQQARVLVQGARDLARQIKGAFEGSGDIKVIDERSTLGAFRRVTTSVRTLARNVRTTLTNAFRRALTFSVTQPINALRRVGRVARNTGRIITRALGGGIIASSFGRLSRIIFSLRGALAGLGIGLGGLALIRRANDVDTLRRAFEQLTGSVGENADTFIRDLRVATRGAVSDLELFRVTNNSVLLGVVQSQEQFVELVTIARRLGRAVGRDTVDALNSLSIGIGRQSRLLLDNLGIIVSVEKANAEYAASIGKSIDELTNMERRQAFLNATLESGREKVESLAPDVLTLADRWGRLVAQISNSASIIAEELVGEGGAFGSIAEFLEKNQGQIRRFARLISNVLTSLFNVLSAIGRDLFSSGSITGFFNRLLTLVTVALRALFLAVSTLLLNLLNVLFDELGRRALELLLGFFFSIGDPIVSKAQELGSRLANNLKQAFLRDLAGSEISRELAVVFFGFDPKRELAKAETEGERIISALEALQRRRQELFKEFVSSSTGSINEGAKEAADEASQTFRSGILDIVDSAREVLPELSEAAEKAFEDFNAAIEDFTSNEGNSAPLRDLSDNSQEDLRRMRAIAEQFQQVFTPFEARIRELREEVQFFGLDESTKELLKFEQAFENLKDELAPADLERLERARALLQSLLLQRDTQQNTQEAADNLEKFNEQLQRFVDQAREAEIGDLAFQFEELGRELEEALVGTTPQQAQAIRQVFEDMADALAQAEIAKVANELNSLENNLDGIERTEAANRIQELEQGFEEFSSALQRANIDAGDMVERLKEMRDTVDDLQETIAFEELAKSVRTANERIKEANDELQRIENTDLENAIADINREYEKLEQSAVAATQELINQRIAAGADQEEIDQLRQRIEEFRNTLEGLRGQEITARVRLEFRREELEDIREFSDTLSQATSRAIIDGLRDSEDGLELAAQFFGRFLEKAIEDAVDNLVKLLEQALRNFDFGAALSGILTGVFAIAGAILTRLEDSTNTTVDDFDEAVTSSEAIRGVVAGPTNVAISRVGSQLKQALRTTELLLEQILQAIQSGSGFGAGGTGGDLSGNAALNLTTSSQS